MERPKHKPCRLDATVVKAENLVIDCQVISEPKQNKKKSILPALSFVISY